MVESGTLSPRFGVQRDMPPVCSRRGSAEDHNACEGMADGTVPLSCHLLYEPRPGESRSIPDARFFQTASVRQDGFAPDKQNHPFSSMMGERV